MKKIHICGVVTIVMFAASVGSTEVAARGFDTIDNAPEEKERGMSPEQWQQLTTVLRDTPNGDKVMRILKKKLPGVI